MHDVVLSGSVQRQMHNIFFQSAHFYNVIPENLIVLTSPNETVRRGSRYLSVTRKQLPTCDRALNTRAQARRFLFRRVIEYELKLPNMISPITGGYGLRSAYIRLMKTNRLPSPPRYRGSPQNFTANYIITSGAVRFSLFFFFLFLSRFLLILDHAKFQSW